jgi:light-regulated signal transduction histidine kinase (bacteriophytochrome)
MITILINLQRQQKLQQELQQVNNSLNTSNEELAVTIEELQTSNEELHTTNEELHTTNEKLNYSNNKLQELNEKVEQVNKELESFSYSVSHDLRTPLRSVVGFSSILQEIYSARLDTEGNRLLGIIAKNALMMGEMIDGLLEFARLGKKALVKTSIDMNKLIGPILEEQKKSYPSGKEIRIKLHPLPQVTADPQLMKQVWSNLISNAFKFTSKTENPLVEIGCREEENEFIFCIKDNGAGFDMQYAGNLFGVFKRLHTQEEFEGNGVGLAIVQRIIMSHGGRIWANGAQDSGASFYFTLPK